MGSWENKQIYRRVKAIPITGISDIRPRSLVVTEAASGKEIRFPRSQVELWPGRIVIPEWLWKRYRLEGQEAGRPGSQKP